MIWKKRYICKVLISITIGTLSGCGYHLTKIVRQSTVLANGRSTLQPAACLHMAEREPDYITNVASSGNGFFIGLARPREAMVLYKILPVAGRVSCYTLPQPAARLISGTDSTITILDRWGGQAILKDTQPPQLTYLVSPGEMKQSLLHEAPGQFAVEGNDQLLVIDEPGQTGIEVASVSQPIWHVISPVLDSNCALGAAQFTLDSVFYQSSEQRFLGFFECQGRRSLAASKDFVAWRTLMSLDPVVTAESDGFSALPASDGGILMKWRQPDANWAAVVAYPGRSLGPVMSGEHARDLIDVWSGMPIGLGLYQGTLTLWGYQLAPGSWTRLGTSVGNNCASFRAGSGIKGQVIAGCWLLRTNGPGTRRAEGFYTKDGGVTWLDF